MLALGIAAVLALAPSLAAQPPAATGAAPGGGGTVEIPLETYNHLLETARSPVREPRPAPAGFALGSAAVDIRVTEAAGRPSAEVRVQLSIRVLEDGWVLIPVLAPGSPVETVQVDGSPVQLLPTPGGLAWSTDRAGTYAMTLAYRVDAARSEAGWSLAVPVPQAAALTLAAVLPGTGLDAAVIPAAGVRSAESNGTTRLTATLPTTSGVQVSWRLPAGPGHTVSRARYAGELAGDAVAFTAELDVELLGTETTTLPLLPRSVTLSAVAVDGAEAPILVEEGRFATRLAGTGRHRVTVGFQVPVDRSQGPPRVVLDLPPVPVSRFELTLPGDKEVSAAPAARVESRRRDGTTRATVYAPMTERLVLSWAEAVPEEIEAEVRANAGLYQAVRAEEGVLYVRTLVRYEISRGATHVLRLEVPPGVQVNRIDSPSGAVADWRIEGDGDDAPRQATVFLDRDLRGEIVLEVSYDRSLGAVGEAEPLALPLLRALDAQRQRGMVALLSGPSLTLEPVDDGGATRVGENQLPAFVRESLEATVAHTFKYVETPPRLVVRPAVPEREAGRFDVRVDTLVSLSDVTLEGAASIEVDVKAGGLTELRLTLPRDVTLLSLSAPSLRQHTEAGGDGGGPRGIDLAFTREMDGQFRVDLTYERILADGAPEVVVPRVAVPGAEVEQGRIAVEALAAVEVRAARAEQLSALDPGELPRQLLLRTTNPILLAYQYARTEAPVELALAVTRHRLLPVQEAAIDEARYRTLVTRDGLAVTAATFSVRNSRKQFLRVDLPAGSEVWSVFVDGKPEKAARAAGGDGEESPGGEGVLIKIVTSTRGFPVELVYATPVDAVSGLGRVRAELARPDILVTHSRWDLYLPAGVDYGEPRSNLELAAAGEPVTPGEMAAEMADLAGGETSTLAPLRIDVPSSGLRFSAEKLYANQAGDRAWIAVPYATGAGAAMGRALTALGTLLLWLGAGLWLRRPARVPAAAAPAAAAVGALLLGLTLGLYRLSAAPAVATTLALAVAAALVLAARAWRTRARESREAAV